MAMTTMQPTPNQIQLEIQVETNNDNIEQPEPDLPEAETPESETPTPTPEPEPEPKKSCLAYMAFIVILLLFLWPFILTLINYYTDFRLWLFIKSTHDTYNDAYNDIQKFNTDINTLTCTFNGENSLQSFENFIYNTRTETECECNYIDNTSPNWDCNTLSNTEWTTTNIDLNTCIDYESDINSKCLQCNNCKSSDFYASNSPYYMYSVELYNDLNNDGEKEKYCSPKKMKENIDDNSMDSYFTHCANACIAFFGISAIWILCGMCSGCKVRYGDLKRSYLWCFKGVEPPKKRGKEHPDDTINQDEFTLFVVSVLLLHVFEDVTQCIIGIMFSIYKQSNGGSDCIIGLNNETYISSVNLISYTGGTSIGGVMSRDSVVLTFFTFSFLSVFFSGLYGIRLFNFDVTKILIYQWWKNLLYAIIGILLGLFFILLVLSPFWGAVWLSSDYLYLTKGESQFLMYTFIAGMGGYVIGICMPLCFADQLECGCDCGDGCC